MQRVIMSGLQVQTVVTLEFTEAAIGNPNRPGVLNSRNPSLLEECVEQLRSQPAGQVRPSFAPIQAWTSPWRPLCRQQRLHANRSQPLAAGRSDGVFLFTALHQI